MQDISFCCNWVFYTVVLELSLKKDLDTSSTTSHSSLALSLWFFHFLLQPGFKSLFGFSSTKREVINGSFCKSYTSFVRERNVQTEMVVVCIIRCCHWSFLDYATSEMFDEKCLIQWCVSLSKSAVRMLLAFFHIVSFSAGSGAYQLRSPCGYHLRPLS